MSIQDHLKTMKLSDGWKIKKRTTMCENALKRILN